MSSVSLRIIYQLNQVKRVVNSSQAQLNKSEISSTNNFFFLSPFNHYNYEHMVNSDDEEMQIAISNFYKQGHCMRNIYRRIIVWEANNSKTVNVLYIWTKQGFFLGKKV